MKTITSSTAAFFGFTFAAFAQAPAKVTYTDHILPILQNACTNCHNPDKKKAGLDLTTYQATIAGSENGPVVKPGNADASLMFKVCAPGGDPKMPPKGDTLSEGDLALLKGWIAGFALESATSKPAQVAQNKVDAASVSLTKPDGPPPMPGDLPLEPFVRSRTGNAVIAMAASPWAPLVAIGGQKQVLLYNTLTLERLGVLAFPEGFPNVLRFSRNAKLLLAGGGLGGKTGKVVLWDVATGDRIGVVGNEADAVLAADISPDQQFVALGGPNKQVKIFRTKDGKQTGLIKKHTEWITAIAYSPDGKYLATADRNGGVEVWETGADPKPFNTLAGHTVACTALAFMPGLLASASEDGKVALWNVKEGSEIKNWAAHAGGVLWVDFTPDGRLVSCGRDKVAKVWDTAGKQIVATEAFADLALRCALNSERVIAADWTGDIRVYALDGKKLGSLSANPGGITEQLTQTEKVLAETQAALPSLQKALSDAEARLKAAREAAEAKRKADIAAAEQRKTDAQNAVEAAKAGPANAEKAIALAKAEVPKAQDALAASRKAAAGAEGAPGQSADTIAAAKSAVAAAVKKVEDLRQQLQNAQNEIANVQAATPKKVAEAEKALHAAEAEVTRLQQPAQREPSPEAIQKVADVTKRMEALTAGIEQLRAERAKLQQGSPEYAKASETLQARKPAVAKIEEELAAAKAAIAAPQPTDAEKAVTVAKSELDAATARLAASQSGVARWKRAQIYQTVFNARQTVAAKQARHDELIATAKDAFRQVELAKQGIVSAEKTVADGPKTVAAKEAELQKLKQAADAATAAHAAAEKALADHKAAVPDPKAIEAEAADAAKKVEALNADVAKRREARGKFAEGSPEYAKADQAVQAIKPELAKAEAALAAAKARQTAKPAEAPVPAELTEAVKKSELEARLASRKVPAAEKAAADAKKAIEDAKKQAADLKSGMAQLEKDAAKTKADAEKAAVASATELQAAKAEADKLRAQYEAAKNASQKAASAAPATPSKS